MMQGSAGVSPEKNQSAGVPPANDRPEVGPPTGADPAREVKSFVHTIIESAVGNVPEPTTFRDTTFSVLDTHQREVVAELRRLRLQFKLGPAWSGDALVLTLYGDERLIRAWKQIGGKREAGK